MARTIIIRGVARRDIRESFEWLDVNVSADFALDWAAGLHARIGSLVDQAEIWPEADESELFSFKLQMMLHRRGRRVHRILFEIQGDTVIVHRVRSASQNSLTSDDF